MKNPINQFCRDENQLILFKEIIKCRFFQFYTFDLRGYIVSNKIDSKMLIFLPMFILIMFLNDCLAACKSDVELLMYHTSLFS